MGIFEGRGSPMEDQGLEAHGTRSRQVQAGIEDSYIGLLQRRYFNGKLACGGHASLREPSNAVRFGARNI